MICINNAGKTINNHLIFTDITLSVDQGSIFGLIGPNGAGKTSLIQCITGLWDLDKGTITVNGSDPFHQPEIKQIIGYIPDQHHFYTSFSVREISRLYELSYPGFDKRLFHTLKDKFTIPWDKKIRELSRGIRMKLSIILSLAIRPRVMIIDEFLTGLDPVIKKSILDLLILEVAEHKTTLFLSTHNLADLERICDDIALIHQGRIIYHNSYDRMRASIRKLQVVCNTPLPDTVITWEGVTKKETRGRLNYLYITGDTEIIIRKLNDLGAVHIELLTMSLEELVVHQIGGGKTYEDIFS